MKKYIELQIELVVFQAQDIVTFSGFNGGTDEFDNPNVTSAQDVGSF